MMTTDIARLPAFYRSLLAPALPRGCVLRRARGDALFAIVPAANGPVPFEAPGFVQQTDGRLTLLCPGAAMIRDLEDAFYEPPDFFAASLVRFRGQPATDEAVMLYAVGVRLLESSTAAERSAWERRLRQAAARALRSNRGGGLYACALLRQNLPI